MVNIDSATSALKTLAHATGMQVGDKAVSSSLEKSSSAAYIGFLRGFFDADGSVQGSQAKGVSVRLAQSDLPRLEAVQRMLLRLGIASSIYQNRRTAGSALLPDGRSGSQHYATKAQHELVISGENLARFSLVIGFADTDKQSSLESLLDNYKRSLNRERFVARVASVTAAGREDVYDVQVPGINTFDANGLHAHNCGEQPLPPYGACLLGSINLTKFVLDPFTDKARFDWDASTVRLRSSPACWTTWSKSTACRWKSNAVKSCASAATAWAILGLGSTITMLRMKYGSAESLEFTEKVSTEMALTGWRTALELAQEKGPAPIMNEDFTVTADMLRKRPEMRQDGYQVGDQVKGRVLHARYSRYMQQMAQDDPELVEELAEHGARFTHHSSIAPTGTISLSLANNASNGIEPSFAHHYSRNVIREGRKSKEKVDVFSFELLAYRTLVNARPCPTATIRTASCPTISSLLMTSARGNMSTSRPPPSAG